MQETRTESERVRRIWERLAPRYDDKVRLPERLLFAGGREWVCARAKGDVLEVSIGTGRNMPLYGSDVRLTGIDLSAAMLDFASVHTRSRERHARLSAVQRDLHRGLADAPVGIGRAFA
jgi:ubiquinone/menaquinone biosynthesis C-methylase UbiE